MFNFPDQALKILKQNVMKYVICLKLWRKLSAGLDSNLCVVRNSQRQQSTMVSSETNSKTTRYEQEKEKQTKIKD